MNYLSTKHQIAHHITMSDKKFEDAGPPGQAATEILDGRIWIDGCFDFFHQYVLRISFPSFGPQESAFLVAPLSSNRFPMLIICI
jgi:hypothetical protein